MIFTPTLANGSSVYNLTGGIQGLAQVTYACASYPSAGTVKLEYQVTGSAAWISAVGPPFETATQPATAQANWELYGAIANLRLTFAGLTGGSGAILAATMVEMRGHPYGSYQGTRALTTQSYTESNSKRGLQFEASFQVASLAAAGTSDILFTTGSLPVIMKDRQIGTNATLLTASIYSGPTVTAGAAIPIYNLCLTPGVGAATTVTMTQVTTTTATGTKVGADGFIIGTTGQAQNTVGTYNVRGAERILQPGTAYLFRVTNAGASTAAVASYFSWFEGQPDLPLS